MSHEALMPSRPRVDPARVRQLLAQGVTQKYVALRLGVSTTVVSYIANGKYREGAK